MLFTQCSFDATKNKLDYYREKDCIKDFCKNLRKHSAKITNHEKKRNGTTNNLRKSITSYANTFHIWKKELSANDRKYQKVKNHCHYTEKYRRAAYNISDLRYKTPKEIIVVFHNGTTYDYHFIIKELPGEFNGQFECLEENTEKNLFSTNQKRT